MPIPSQLVSYRLGVIGMDQRTDPRALPLPRPAVLENFRFTKDARIEQRNGWEQATDGMPVFGGTQIGGALLGAQDKLFAFTYGNNPIVPGSSNISQCSRAWAEQLEAPTLMNTTITTKACTPDMVETADDIIFAYPNGPASLSTITIRYVNKTTRQATGFTLTAASTVANVRLLVVGSDVLLGYMRTDGNLLVNVITSTGFSLRATIAGGNTTTCAWDWATGGGTNYLGVAMHAAAVNDVLIRTFSAVFAVSSSATYATGGAVTSVGVCFSAGVFVVGAGRTTTLLRIGYTYALAVSWASATEDTAAAGDVCEAVTVVDTGNQFLGSQAVFFYAQWRPAASPQTYTRYIRCTASTPAGAFGLRFERLGLWLVAKCAHYNSVVVAYDDDVSPSGTLPTQRAYYLMSSLGTVQARWIYTQARAFPVASLREESIRPNTIVDPDGGYSCIVPRSRDLPMDSFLLSGAFSPVLLRFSFDQIREMSIAESWSENLITASALYSTGTGEASVAMSGYFMWPTFISAVGSNAGGSVSPSSAYSLIAVYERFDNSGRLVQSAVSVPRSVTTGGADNRIVAVVQNYRLPGDNTPNTTEKIVIYRTTAGGTVYFRDVSAAALHSANSTTINLTASDATLGAQSQIYTQGGVLENYTPSCPVGLASSGRRLLAIQGDDPTGIYESKVVGADAPTSFALELRRDVSIGGSPLRAIGYLDGRWFAATAGELFVATGDGADNTGANDTLSDFTLFSTKVGCARQSLFISTPFGILFRSPSSGFWLIGRDGGLVYVGAGVEDYNSADVTSMIYDRTNQIVMAAIPSASVILTLTLFDTERGTDYRWGVDTAQSFNTLALANGRLYAATAGLNQNIYTPSADVLDAQTGDRALPRIVTGWIIVGQGAQGRGRVRRIMILGHTTRLTPPYHSITVNLYTDYSDTAIRQTVTITGTNATDSGAELQFELQPNFQKCQAIKIEIIAESSNDDDKLYLSDIQLDVAVKPGSARLLSPQNAA